MRLRFGLVFCILFDLHLVEFTSEFDDLLEGRRFVHASHILLFVSSEWNLNQTEQSQFEVEIESVNQRKVGVESTSCDFKQVTLVQILVCTREVATKARELVFNESFDASIFNHIAEHVTHTGTRSVTDEVLPTFHWSMQGMGNLVADEHVVNRVVHVFPYRKNQSTRFSVECRSFGIRTMLDSDVFSGHTPCKDVLDGCSGFVR